MTLSTIPDQGYSTRAKIALLRRANKYDGSPNEPGEVQVVRLDHPKGPRDYVVLANVNGILGVFRIQYLTDGTNRLKWLDRGPQEQRDAYGG